MNSSVNRQQQMFDILVRKLQVLDPRWQGIGIEMGPSGMRKGGVGGIPETIMIPSKSLSHLQSKENSSNYISVHSSYESSFSSSSNNSKNSNNNNMNGHGQGASLLTTRSELQILSEMRTHMNMHRQLLMRKEDQVAQYTVHSSKGAGTGNICNSVGSSHESKRCFPQTLSNSCDTRLSVPDQAQEKYLQAVADDERARVSSNSQPLSPPRKSFPSLNIVADDERQEIGSLEVFVNKQEQRITTLSPIYSSSNRGRNGIMAEEQSSTTRFGGIIRPPSRSSYENNDPTLLMMNREQIEAERLLTHTEWSWTDEDDQLDLTLFSFLVE